MAREGHQALLQSIFGSGESSQRPAKVPLGVDGKPRRLTPAAFDVNFPGKSSDRRITRRKGR